MEVGLVSCTKSKRAEPAPPGKLYEESSLFRKSRAYCERNHDEWYVLSAKHGLLEPNGPSIEPYDLTLKEMPVTERREWGREVATDLEPRIPNSATLVIHASMVYYEPLLEALDDIAYEIPTEGLRIGETKAWYNEQLEEPV